MYTLNNMLNNRITNYIYVIIKRVLMIASPLRASSCSFMSESAAVFRAILFLACSTRNFSSVMVGCNTHYIHTILRSETICVYIENTYARVRW